MRGGSIPAILPAFSRYAICCLLACILISAASRRAGTQSHAITPKSYPQFSCLRVGEVLSYRVDWRRFAGVAMARLEIAGRGQHFGTAAWHFRATLHTDSPLRTFDPLDDQIDSYALLTNLQSSEYQEHTREFGRSEDSVVSLVSPGEARDVPRPRVIVPRGTRDALSAIYFLRLTDWQAVSQVRTPVFDGENVYDMVAVREMGEVVRVPAGNFVATKISIRLLRAGTEVPDEHFIVWLANDSSQTPILWQAYLPIGSLRVELISDSAWPGKF